MNPDGNTHHITITINVSSNNKGNDSKQNIQTKRLPVELIFQVSLLTRLFLLIILKGN